MIHSRDTLQRLEEVLEQRRNTPSEQSYTSRLMSGGPQKIGEKVVEEAVEVVQAATSESDERVVSEASDLLYHLLVLLAFRKVPFQAVEEELARRFGISGLVEKASRKSAHLDSSGERT
ncbi:MAG: phosphoribosyl-ATP diphosphatase [Planctomycetota bacterium]|nr:MAG: phosphoribosyl-ATP diphosphatase [Planctomycetota bacterium]